MNSYVLRCDRLEGGQYHDYNFFSRFKKHAQFNPPINNLFITLTAAC